MLVGQRAAADRHAGPFRPGSPGNDALITSRAWIFPRACAPSATSTSPRHASSPAVTSTTARRRTCPPRGSAPGWPGWRRRGPSGPLPDPHDEAHLSAAEEQKRVTFARLELHRRNPLFHLGELDLSCYDRDYAPKEERDAARAAHLTAWPQVADAAIESLDQVNAPVAEALLGGIRGLAAGLTAGTGGGPGEEALAAARAAHARLVAHVERAVAQGDPDPALGGPALAALMGGAEALPVDLGRLAEQADAERDRLHALLADGCARLGSGHGSRPPLDVARELVRDHPDGPA